MDGVTGGRASLAGPIRTIAVLRALYLGDLLVSVPAFRALRAGYPSAQITLIGLPWAEELVSHLRGYIDRFVPFGTFPGDTDVPYDHEQSARFIAAQRACSYDLVIQMHGSGGWSNPCALALGGRNTVGYYLHEPPEGMTAGIPYDDYVHEIDLHLRLAGLAGGVPGGRWLELSTLMEDRREAGRILRQAPPGRGPLIVMHPGAKPEDRRWPAERFIWLADELVRRHGARLVLTGTDAERDTVDRIAAGVSSPTLNLAGRTSLGTLAALLEAADLYVGNDTGPAHLSEAVGTPTVRIYGSTDPARWGPLDRIRHRVVLPYSSSDGSWVWAGQEAVLDAVEEMLLTSAAGRRSGVPTGR